VFFQVVEVDCQHLLVLLRAGEHDGAFNDSHDVLGERPGIDTQPPTRPLYGGIEVWLELQGHFVETLRQPAPKPVVRIAERGAEVADDGKTKGKQRGQRELGKTKGTA